MAAVAPPSAHSREYEVAYKATYDAALAAAEAEAAALRARLADTTNDASHHTATSHRNTRLHVLDDKENAGPENDAPKRPTAGDASFRSFAPLGTFAKVYHDAGCITTGSASDDAMLGPVRGARTAKALRATDAILGRHERNDGYGRRSAEG